MDSFRSEDEQIQALKTWWKENGMSTLLTVCVALAVVFGWRGWQNQQQANVDAAAFAYQNMLEAVAAAEAQPDDIKIASAMHLADQIKQDFGKPGMPILPRWPRPSRPWRMRIMRQPRQSCAG